MNEVTQAAAQLVRHGWIPGVMTGVFLAFFLGWTWWAYRPANASRLDAASRMPLEES